MSEALPAIPSWPSASSVSQADTIERLCNLLGSVWNAFDPDAHEANDCFCGEREPVLRFQSSGQALRWVELVVEQALASRGSDRELAALRKIAAAATELSDAMVDCWGPAGTEERVTWDAPHKQVVALRSALEAMPTIGTGEGS